MEPLKQLEVLASTIPQVYIARTGPHQINFNLNEHQITRWSFNRFTPELNRYKSECEALLNGFQTHRPLYPGPQEENRLTEYFAMRWLSICTPVEARVWKNIFDYFYQLNRRTNENNFIHKTIRLKFTVPALTPIELNLNNTNINKVLDLLGSGPTTRLVVDSNLNVIDIESIDVSTIPQPEGYVYYPDFIGPQVESCDDESVLITSTVKGDLLVCYKKKLIASKRRDKWTMYDPNTFKNTIHGIIGDYWLGCNLYGVLLDLSYRRHGGLIVIDNHRSFLNTEYINPSPQIFDPILPATRYNQAGVRSADKKRLIEFSSVDGAILISKDHGQIHSFGRIVKTHHEHNGNGYGARSTAAESAVRHGGIALKVSSDGDISILFKNHQTGDDILKINYL